MTQESWYGLSLKKMKAVHLMEMFLDIRTLIAIFRAHYTKKQ